MMIFELEIDIESALEKTYGYSPTSKLLNNSSLFDESRFAECNITSLVHSESKKYKFWIDPGQSEIKMWVTMIDWVTEGPLPITTDMPCWHCKDGFETSPIGAPLKYNSHSIDGKKVEIINKHLSRLNLPLNTNEFFETEGIFCSLPCTKAWCIEKAKLDIRYKDSGALLGLLCCKLFGRYIEIEPAASWRLIDRWGGHLSINEFRSTFCKLTYTITPNIKRPYMYSVGTYVEETRIF